MKPILFCLLAALALPATASDSLQWSGFGLVRASSRASNAPFFDDGGLSAQFHLGVDWHPSLMFGAHLHLLARDDAAGARRGHVGIPEAYVEANFRPQGDRLRIRAGAFFLPTSRENVDAQWESPYTITPSALNSWLGEEFRPIGLDLTYTMRGSVGIGATVFRGNDTFGALPAVRGWALRDHWALLGEHLPVDSEVFTSVSAETDHRLGWSGRVLWQNEHAVAQLTRIDNRADADLHGELYNWSTRFDLASASYTIHDWTVAAESGWGPSGINVGAVTYVNDLRANYLLLSRRFSSWRVTVRSDSFQNDDGSSRAVTAALLWSPRGPWRSGLELSKSGPTRRALIDIRFNFSGP